MTLTLSLLVVEQQDVLLLADFPNIYLIRRFFWLRVVQVISTMIKYWSLRNGLRYLGENWIMTMELQNNQMVIVISSKETSIDANSKQETHTLDTHVLRF